MIETCHEVIIFYLPFSLSHDNKITDLSKIKTIQYAEWGSNLSSYHCAKMVMTNLKEKRTIYALLAKLFYLFTIIIKICSDIAYHSTAVHCLLSIRLCLLSINPYPANIFFVLKTLSAFYICYIYSNALQTRFYHGSKLYEL